jgi:hypothetical protein
MKGPRLSTGRISPWWKLVALCVGANLTEVALVMGFDHGARPVLAPQASAIAPFGVFSDLRWVSVYHDSWAGFAGEIVAMLIFRGALTALSVHLAWPGHLERPRPSQLLWRGIFSTFVAAAFLAPSVALLFGLAVVPVSWLFLAAVPAALLVALIVHPMSISGDWWRRSLSPRALGWVALSFVVLSVSTAVMAGVPSALWPIVAALCGLFNAWAWVGLVHAVVDRRPAKRVVPVVPAALLALVGVAILGTVLGFSHNHPTTSVGTEAAPPAGSGGKPLLVVSGYGSTWTGRAKHRIPGDFDEVQFSYKGLGPGSRPEPYDSADTVKALSELDEMFIAQVDALHASSGRDVDVVAESEGSLISKTALLADPAAPVSALVVASPLVAPGRVFYPTGGSDEWGVVSQAGMKLLGSAFQGVAPIDLSPDSTFLASLDHKAPLLGTAMGCPVAGVRQFAFLPLADATVTPPGTKLSYPYVVVPAFHGGLLESAPIEKRIAMVLTNHPVGDDQLLRMAEDAITSASGAWQVPALVTSDYPGTVTNAASRSDAGASDTSCRQVAAELRASLPTPR